MPTEYTTRLIVVVRAARKDAANTAAKVVDPGGGDVFGDARLRFTTSVPTAIDAYICNWPMKPEENQALRNALKNNGFSNREIGLVAAGSNPNMNDDLWAFDAALWTPAQVLTSLGMTTSDFDPITH